MFSAREELPASISVQSGLEERVRAVHAHGILRADGHQEGQAGAQQGPG